MHRFINQHLLKIRFDGELVDLGSTIPKNIEYLNIIFKGQFIVDKAVAFSVKYWLNEVIDNFSGDFATFNGTLVNKRDIKKF